MNRVVYGSVAVAGIVFSVLEFLSADNPELGYSLILATIFMLGLIYLGSEWRYYRRHNALLASIQFLVVPGIMLLAGNYLAPRSYQSGIINFQIRIFHEIYATSSLVSLVLLLPIVMILGLTARYYDGRYPGFVIRRRQFGPLAFPLMIHLLITSGIIGLSVLVGYVDFLGLVFLVLTVVQFIQKLIIPVFNSGSDQDWERDRRGFLSSVLGNSRSRNQRRQISSGSSRSNPASRSDTPTRSASRSNRRHSREVSTTPTGGYREVPTRSRSSGNGTPRPTSTNSSRSSSRSSSSPSTGRRSSVAEVDHGIEAVTPSRAKKVKQSKLKDYLPKGNYDHTDLKCMVCYEDFSEKSRKNIVVCPSCKFPAHEVEFKSWLNTSPRCPRCNKEVKNNRKLNSGTVPEYQYAKFIRKL